MKMHESPYVGRPGIAIDKAWQDLLGDMSIRITKAELEQNDQTSIELPRGGYLAWLGAFHQLHCVVRTDQVGLKLADHEMQKMLRQLNYRDHYHPNLTVKELADWQVHTDHCLELLRASAMCHVDTSSLTTFMWDKSEKPMLNLERPAHRCVDWDGLILSIKHRGVSEEEVESMLNPLLHSS